MTNGSLLNNIWTIFWRSMFLLNYQNLGKTSHGSTGSWNADAGGSRDYITAGKNWNLKINPAKLREKPIRDSTRIPTHSWIKQEINILTTFYQRGSKINLINPFGASLNHSAPNLLVLLPSRKLVLYTLIPKRKQVFWLNNSDQFSPRMMRNLLLHPCTGPAIRRWQI